MPIAIMKYSFTDLKIVSSVIFIVKFTYTL